MSRKTGLFSIVLIVFTLFGSCVFNDDVARSASRGEIRQFAAGAAIDPSMAERRTISAYDAMMRRIAREEGLDWLLMSAIAYNESRFESDLISNQGAIGLMQVMPRVGKQFNVEKEHLTDPETNIRLAGRILKKIDATLKLGAAASEDDRMSIILACYNGGIGHVSDARRLARNNGEDPNSWEVVVRYLHKKADPEVYESELVRCGKFTGSRRTEAYVRDVMKRYDTYREMTAKRE